MAFCDCLYDEPFWRYELKRENLDLAVDPERVDGSTRLKRRTQGLYM